ncbi:MAG TPA: helix-turn-helix transcriptional regulator, partial [Candidatus Obscuribacterales bacterium]
DNLITWDGSLNALSHRNTFERMTRLTSRHFAMETITKWRLDTCIECWNNRCRLSFGKAQTQLHVQLLAEQLLQARRPCMSQYSIADLAGIDQAMICRLEAGSANIKNGLLVQMAGILGYELIPVPNVLVPAVTTYIHEQLSARGARLGQKSKRK